MEKVKYFSVGDFINSKSKLERKMPKISSDLDQEDCSAGKNHKTLCKLVHFKHFSASVIAVIDTRYSAEDSADVIVGQNQYGYYSI